MAEPNGHQDNESRLDRIERVVEHAINEHEKLIDDHRQLLKAQVVMMESIDKIGKHIVEVDTRLGTRIDEIGDKLDGLIGLVDSDHREFHERLKRLEGRELHG